MINIECTRCGATGNDYPTYYVDTVSLKHETGCGARLGIPKYSEGKTKPTEEQTTVISEKKETKKKTKKKKVHTILDSSNYE